MFQILGDTVTPDITLFFQDTGAYLKAIKDAKTVSDGLLTSKADVDEITGTAKQSNSYINFQVTLKEQNTRFQIEVAKLIDARSWILQRYKAYEFFPGIYSAVKNTPIPLGLGTAYVNRSIKTIKPAIVPIAIAGIIAAIVIALGALIVWWRQTSANIQAWKAALTYSELHGTPPPAPPGTATSGIDINKWLPYIGLFAGGYLLLTAIPKGGRRR